MCSEKKVLKKIGEKLECLRLNKSALQEDVAKSINISRTTISRIENGSNFSVKNLIKLLEEYNRLDDFLNIITLPKGFDVKKYNKALKNHKKLQKLNKR